MDEDTQIKQPASPSKRKKILIVEDDFYIRDLYVTQATLMGYEVLTAVDGTEGLDKIMSESPDLVVLDLMIPKIDGMTILRTIRKDQNYSSIPVLVVTNLEDSDKEKEIKELGVVDYFVKLRHTPDSIIQRINTFFASGK